MKCIVWGSIILLLPMQALAVSPEAKESRKRLESLVSDAKKGKYNENPEALTKKVSEENQRLLAYLETHSSDTDAILILMEYYEARQALEFTEMPKQADLPESLQVPSGPYVAMREARTAPYHSVLDRALSQDPNNADLHAWKGRLYSLYEPLPDSTYSQLPLAIAELRRAVTLAPDNATHREWLGIMLLTAGREADAKSELKQIKGGKHPIYVLLKDWEAIPEPPGVSRYRRFESSMGEMASASGEDLATVRYRAYLFPGSAAEVETLYRTTWPGLRLFANPDRSDTTTVTFSQYFRWKKGKLEPHAKKFEDVPDDADEGIILQVIEFHGVVDAEYADPAIAGKEVHCNVIFSNERTIKN